MGKLRHGKYCEKDTERGQTKQKDITGLNSCAQEGYAFPISNKTLVILIIVQSFKSLEDDRGMTKSALNQNNYYCHVRSGCFVIVNGIAMTNVYYCSDAFSVDTAQPCLSTICVSS